MSNKTHTQSPVKFVKETQNAILIKTANEDEIWIPFSQVESIEREPNGIDGSITMSAWIAGQKGLL